jgi:hypothetical protein
VRELVAPYHHRRWLGWIQQISITIKLINNLIIKDSKPPLFVMLCDIYNRRKQQDFAQRMVRGSSIQLPTDHGQIIQCVSMALLPTLVIP